MCEDDIFCGVNEAKSANVDEMTDLEKKHTPRNSKTPALKPKKNKKLNPINIYILLYFNI
jgi:hypothetical protein